MTNVIKGLRAALARPWQPQVIDCTVPGSGVTPEERAFLLSAARVIAGQPARRNVVDLEWYRRNRRHPRGGADQ